MYSTPATYADIIGGKWLSRLILGMGQIIILFAAGKIIFNIYLGRSIPALFLLALFFCGTVAGMSILLGSVIRKEEVLVVFNILIANLMAALGGCWFPQEFFPAVLKKISMIFPTGWIMEAFSRLLFFGGELRSVLIHLFVLLLFTLVFLFLAAKFFKLKMV
jgi:ABC-type multidrug transport system permease subunit